MTDSQEVVKALTDIATFLGDDMEAEIMQGVHLIQSQGIQNQALKRDNKGLLARLARWESPTTMQGVRVIQGEHSTP